MEKLKHAFYQQTPKQQKQFIWKVAGILLLLILAVFALIWISNWYWLIFVIPLTLSVLAPFIDVPTGVKSGQLKHYSPLFIASKERKGEVVIHGGTLFDYYFTLGVIPAAERKKAIVLSYMQGLIGLVEHYEKIGKKDMIIKGTSYIINERTANKMGFKVIGTDADQKFIMGINYFPILISYSYSKGSISFPNLRKVKTFRASIKELAPHKQVMIELIKKLDPPVKSLQY